ncbi:MAG: hypothetical protein GXP54_05820 [Deltaproteobacteria bacterium]|nr:hypothetical protein [Deltaproteobacteria bacterium]
MTDSSPFELRDSDHTDLFGIFLAVHAVPGTVLFLHTTVGCKFKTQLHLVEHDWFRESHNQRIWTGLEDVELIRGTGKHLVQFAQTWYGRRTPDLVVVATNTVVDLSPSDVEVAVEELRERLPCPVILLNAPGYEGSLGRGYSRMIGAVMDLLDWDVEPDPRDVALIGYPFDRFEMDHAANLRELKRLLARLGLTASGTLFSGEGLAALRATTKAKTLALLPLAQDLDTGKMTRKGRIRAPVDLPVGLNGTSRFLREIGGAAGVPKATIEEVIDAETAKVAPLLAHPARVLEDMHRVNVSVFLDAPLAAAVTAFLLDLGAAVRLVCVTGDDRTDMGSFKRALNRHGVKDEEMPRVLLNPSRDAALGAFRDLRGPNEVHIVVGSAIQKQALAREGARVLELGYPSTSKHQIYPMPWMGYNGAVGLAQRLMDAMLKVF